MIIRAHKIGKDITATITINGDQRQFATISFAANDTIIGDIINLSPEIQHITGIVLQTIYRKITINNIRMRFPYSFGTGEIELRCDYTNLNGSNSKTFNGIIASWTLEGI